MKVCRHASYLFSGLLLLLLVGLSLPALPAQAQTPDKSPLKITTEAQTRERLTQKVRLNLGTTTLPAVMRELSEQTGIQIEAEGYLREHRLQICLNDVSALAALETLCELNDWKWQITEPGRALLGRLQPKTPLTITDVFLALQTAWPKDFRRFLGSDGGLKPPMYSPGGTPNLSRSENAALKPLPPQNRLSNVARARNLFETLTPQMQDQKPVLCARLAPEQQQALLVTLTLATLGATPSPQGNPFANILRSHQRDPNQIDVSVQNGNFMLIGTFIDEVINGKRHMQGGGTTYQIDAPSTNNSKMLRFGGPKP